jgi:hypothetical protein
MAQEFLIATVLSAHALKRSGVGDDCRQVCQRGRHRLLHSGSQSRLRLTLVVVAGPMGASVRSPPPSANIHRAIIANSWFNTVGGRSNFQTHPSNPSTASVQTS